MKSVSLCAVAAAAIVLASCEIPRNPSPQEPTAPVKAPKPAPQPKPIAAKPVQKPQVQQDTRQVDGRRPAPLARYRESQPSHRSATYRYGALPMPLKPEAGSVTIAPTASPASEVAASKAPIEGPLVVVPQNPLVERSLIGKGAEVLDRSVLELIQSEHFIQRAAAVRRDFDGWSRASKAGATRAPQPVVVGRDAARLRGLNLWLLDEKEVKPLLNGSAVAAAEKLSAGQMRSARSILSVGDTKYKTRVLDRKGKRPVADSVGFGPIVVGKGPESLPQVGKAAWEADGDDSYHYVANGGQVYFDAERGVFWRMKDAWIGRDVTRREYLQARSQPLEEVCEKCGHVHRSNNPDAPVAADHPEHWQCPECKDKMLVQYLDGYGVPLHKAAKQMIVQASEVRVPAGIYPVASTKTGRGDLLAGACIEGEAPKKTAVAKRLHELAVLPKPDAWCLLQADGSSLVISMGEWALLRRQLATTGWPLPQVDRVGGQVFGLLGPSHDDAKVSVHVEAAEVEVRATSVTTGELLVVGTVEVDYLNLLPQQVVLPIHKDGAALQDWPTSEQQRHLLDKEVARRIADLVVR